MIVFPEHALEPTAEIGSSSPRFPATADEVFPVRSSVGRKLNVAYVHLQDSPENERTMPLRGDALDMLQEMRDARTPSRTLSGPVFVDADGDVPKPDRVSKRFKFFVRKAKLSGREQIRFHSLRHSCASWLIQQGVPLAVVSEILGHSSTEITDQTYSHVSSDAVTEAMDDVFGGIG